MLLVRHGQSEWNALGRWQGQADPPLSDLGRTQAHSAAQRVGTVDVIVSSDLQRAFATAEIISRQIGVGPIVVEPLLRERDAGEWSGLTSDEIDDAWPGYLENGRRPPGFEPTEAFLERIVQGLDNIVREYAGAEVLVMTHGGVVYLLEAHHGAEFERLANLQARHVTHLGERLVLGKRVHLLGEDDELTTVPVRL
jgi:broad specificity phosphatase PhoE